jgi:hypothetical protein
MPWEIPSMMPEHKLPTSLTVTNTKVKSMKIILAMGIEKSQIEEMLCVPTDYDDVTNHVCFLCHN